MRVKGFKWLRKISLMVFICSTVTFTKVNAEETVKEIQQIKSDGKLEIENTGVILDSEDLKKVQSVVNNNSTVLNNVNDITEYNSYNISKEIDEYSSSNDYTVGELCIHDNKVYVSNSYVSNEEWDESHWKETSLVSEVSNLNSYTKEIIDSFQNGCDIISAAITSEGVATGKYASPSKMADNIEKACLNHYNDGVKYGKSLFDTSLMLLGNYNNSNKDREIKFNNDCDVAIVVALVTSLKQGANPIEKVNLTFELASGSYEIVTDLNTDSKLIEGTNNRLATNMKLYILKDIKVGDKAILKLENTQSCAAVNIEKIK